MVSDPKTRLAVLEGGGPTSEDVVSMLRSEDCVIGEAVVPEAGRVEFEATNIRKDRTGVHARIAITKDGAMLACDVFNVERARDRTYLANQAGDRLGDGKRYGKPLLVRLEQFCVGIWSAWIDADHPEMMTATEPTGVDWLIEPFVARGAGTILYGPPKACKSWLGMLWAASLLVEGGPWPGRQGKVLFVNLERPAQSVRSRLWCIGRAMGVQTALPTYNRRGHSLAALAPAIARHAHDLDLVVVDSLSRSGTGDLNANDSANEAMDLLNSFGMAWCILAHTPRSDATHVYGSQMFDAAADLLVRVQSVVGGDNLTRGVLLDRQAANDAPPCRPELWAFDFDDRGLSGVRKPKPGEFPDLDPQSMTLPQRIEEYLLCEGSAPSDDVARELDIPQGTIRRILNADPRFTRLGAVGKGRGSRSRWAVVATLPEHFPTDP